MDREGNYLRELYPPPAALTPDRTAGLKFLKLADGSSMPRADGICWLYSKKLAFAGKLAVTPDNKTLLVAASKSRELFQFGLDGSLPASSPTALPDGARPPAPAARRRAALGAAVRRRRGCDYLPTQMVTVLPDGAVVEPLGDWS